MSLPGCHELTLLLQTLVLEPNALNFHSYSKAMITSKSFPHLESFRPLTLKPHTT